MIKKTGFLLLLYIFFSANIFSESRNIKFESISNEEGLSQSIVYCTLQDSRGFLWFGTEDGLNRYDGYQFLIFRHDQKNPDSISHNDIRVILEDRSGFLWIGTFHGGLTKYDPETGNFSHYRKTSGNPRTLSNDAIWSIHQDQSGILWIGTDEGLNKFNSKTNTFSVYKCDLNDPFNKHNPSGNEIYSILGDENPDVLWIGTKSGGLDKFNIKTEIFTHYKTGDNSKTASTKDQHKSEIYTIYKDRKNMLWIGTDGNGLSKFNQNTEQFTHYRANPLKPKSLSNNIVKAIFEDSSGVLWVGTDSGLNKFEKKTEEFTIYKNHPNKPDSLSHNEIRSIYEDKSGILWIGTYGGGINKHITKQQKFIHYKSEPDNLNSLSNNIVWSFCEDREEILWIGTHGGGLNKFDRKNNLFTIYKTDLKDPNSINNNSVRQVFEDRSGVLWLGTNGGGLNKFNKKTGKIIQYKNDPNNSKSLSHNEIRSIYEDRSRVLWIGTHGGGLNRFNKKDESFTRFQANEKVPGSLSNNVIRYIYEDHSKTLWIATYGGGLNKFNRKDNKFIHYRADPNDPKKLSNDYIFAIYEDISHNLWIGTWGGGLNRFDTKKEIFYRYSIDDGLPSNSIYGILEDNNQNLWISTTNGLSKFNIKTEKFRNYSKTNGLQSNEFNGGAYYKSLSGEMFFGGINGFNAFYPDAIVDNQYIPPIIITSFQKMNKKIKLDKPITAIDTINLSYKDYFFSFEFAALDYTIPIENKYAYKMEGLDEDWIYTSSDKRFASYTTLDSGTYVFRVKGSNNDGVWNEKGKALTIIISPPVWKTWWFQFLSAILLIFVFWALYRKKIKDLFIRTHMEAELKTAHAAQMSIMPNEDPEIEDFDIASIYIPAYEVGGDFFDYLWVDKKQTHFGIVVGDVSGKAMKAAIPAVMANGIIFSKASETNSITEIMLSLNESLYKKTDKRIFTALLIIAINLKSKKMNYINAGLPELILKSDDSIIELKSPNSKFPLGIVEKRDFVEETIQLKVGDIIVLYTDGISESLNDQQEFYGKNNLITLLKELNTKNLQSQTIIDKIMEDIKTFSKGTNQHDDITLIVIKVNKA